MGVSRRGSHEVRSACRGRQAPGSGRQDAPPHDVIRTHAGRPGDTTAVARELAEDVAA
jgi:hypothetical protein